MDYVIKNSKQVYIRLNENGQPITCGENRKQLFEFSKAKNIHSNLSNKLKRMNFRVEAIPDVISKPKKCVKSDTYKIPNEILEWQDKFKTVDEITSEAKKRIDEISELLHENSQKTVDTVHKIELENDKDMYGGWLLYAKFRDLRRRRRELKDEKLVLNNIFHMNFRDFSSEQIEKTIAGLAKRKYEMRIIEEDDEVDESL